MSRPDFDTYFLDGANWAAARADCTRRKVGAIIVDTDHRVIATGYNGSHPGGPSCLAGECPRGRMTYKELVAHGSYDNCTAVHAEANALLFARASVKGATLYCTDEPCPGCWKLIRGAQIGRVVTPHGEVDL